RNRAFLRGCHARQAGAHDGRRRPEGARTRRSGDAFVARRARRQAQRGTVMSGPLRIGVVGLGRLGKRHAENLAYRVSGAALVAACSPVEEERAWARAALPAPRLYDDYHALLEDRDVDAVWLVTPSALHAQQIIDALRAGK